MPVKMMEKVGMNEKILNHIEEVHKSLKDGRELPDLPKGIKLADLPKNVRTLYELKQGKVPSGDVTEIFKA